MLDIVSTFQKVSTKSGQAQRDKATVESMVLVAQRWILARLRHRTFFELAELNAAISELLEELNGRPLQKLGVSRRELWERLDRPALKPPHPEQGYRACLGLMRLGRRYGPARLEAACDRADLLRSYSYRTVKNILAMAQDRLPLDPESPVPPTPSHENIRGGRYYAAEQEKEC